MINLTVVIDNDEAIRRFKELQSVAKTTTSSVVTDSDRMDAAIHRVASTLAQIGVAASLTGLVRKIALVRGEFQQLEVAFTTLLQSKEKADALMAQMIDLAAKTPFDLQGVANGARQLLAYGFAAEDITDTLTRLGNVAAGLGLPLERLTYLYGTTAVQGRLYARDMLQFTSSGIPVLQEMAKIYGKTTEEINSMVSAGKIGFEDVRKVIENMTNEGGQFYNLMQEQSKTITGLISNLGDALDTMFNDIGKSQEGIIAGVLQGTISLVENYQKVLDIVAQLVVAYGTYKTALIILTTAEKLRYQAALAHGAGLTTLQALTEVLTAKTKALNKAMLSNPYILAAAAVAGLAVVIYNLVTAKSAEERAMEKVNNAIDEYNQKLDEQKSKAEQLHSVMNDDVNTVYSKQKAYQDLIEIYPELLEKYSEEEIRLMTLIDLTKELNRIKDTRQENNLREKYEAALKKVRDLKDELANGGSSYFGAYGGNPVVTNSLALEQAEAELDELRKKIHEFEKTKKAAEWNNTPVEVKRVSLQENISELKRQIAEINALIDKSPKGLAGNLILQRDANIRELGIKEKELATLSTTTKEPQNKTYWEKIKKNAQEAINAMDVSLKGSEKWKDLEKQIADANEKIALFDTSGKSTQKTLETQEKLNEQILSNDQDLIQSRIDLMKDGQDKEIAEINARTQAKIESIEKAREKEEKAARAAGTSLTPERKKEFEEQRINAEKKGDNEIIATKKKYAEELDGIYKQITDVSLTEIDREIIGIEDKYKELSKKIMAAMEGGSISADDAGRTLLKLDAAKTAETLDKILGQYKSTQQKITTIQKNAEAARKLARDNGQESAIERINKEEARAIGKIKAEDLMDSDDWINLFQNLDALSSREIRLIVENINEQLKNADLDPVNLKAVTDQLQRALDVAGNKNPFAGVIAGFKDYKEAQKKAIALQKKANETQDESDKIAADNAALDAIKKRQEAWQRVLNTVGDIGNSLQALNDLLGQFGVESPELEGVIGAFNSLSSIDVTKPFSIITGTVGAISSLIGGIFGGHDKRAEKRIQALQKSVEALEKAYEDLSEAVDKTYSRARQAVIASENKNLEAQKRLINQQIREEQSKKKTDQNRIKEWQEQLDNINKEIQNNKEAAYDAIFGEDLQSAISNFADAYADAWASGTSRAESAKDTVRKMMRQMATESIKDAISTSGAIQKIRDKLTEFYADNVLSEWEQNYIYKLADDLQRELDNKFGWADKLFTGESETGTLRGEISQSITEATASKLEGLMRGGYDLLKGIHGEAFKQTSLQQSNLNVNTGIFNAVIRIQANTARTANNTDGMTDLLTSLYSMLQKIAQNTATKYYGK